MGNILQIWYKNQLIQSEILCFELKKYMYCSNYDLHCSRSFFSSSISTCFKALMNKSKVSVLNIPRICPLAIHGYHFLM